MVRSRQCVPRGAAENTDRLASISYAIPQSVVFRIALGKSSLCLPINTSLSFLNEYNFPRRGGLTICPMNDKRVGRDDSLHVRMSYSSFSVR